MEHEPVYVVSSRLRRLCEGVLARIFEIRQSNKESYVNQRVHDLNMVIRRKNRWRKLFGMRPHMFVTPQGMEQIIYNEVAAMGAKRDDHVMIRIHQEYGGLEHEAKDAMIQCQWSDTVPISAGFVRGVSHLGCDMSMLSRQPFGFKPGP